MIAPLVSLVAVALGFFALLAYVYRPSQRQIWRQKGISSLDLPDEEVSADIGDDGSE